MSVLKKVAAVVMVCLFYAAQFYSQDIGSYYLSPPNAQLTDVFQVQSQFILQKAHDNTHGKSNVYAAVSPDRLSLGTLEAENVAKALRKTIKKKGKAVVVLAAAPSQDEFLAELRKQKVDWSNVIFFHLDEYLDLPKGHPNTFQVYLNDHFFSWLPIAREQLHVHFMKDMEGSAEEICRKYSQLIVEAGGIDIACIGIGENGHIAFNDPGALFNDPELMRVVEMDEMCRWQQFHDYENDPNKKYKNIDDVPKHALTMTIPALLSAGQIFCSVPGPAKRFAVRSVIKGPVTHAYPASILKRHTYTRFYFDPDSANLLGLTFEKGETRFFKVPQEASPLNIKELSKKVNIKEYPKNQVGVIIDFNDEADMATKGVQYELKELSNEITILKTVGNMENLPEIIERVRELNPDFVFIPHRSDKRSNATLLRFELGKVLLNIANTQEKPIRIFEYQTTVTVSEDNLIYMLDKTAHEVGETAGDRYPSQKTRLPFDVVRDLATRSTMAILRSLHLIPSAVEGEYAESYDVSLCNGGEFTRPTGKKYFIGEKMPSDRFQPLSFEDSYIVFLEPHYDDMVYASGGLMSFLVRCGCFIQSICLTEGHRTKMYHADGTVVREKQIRVALREGEEIAAFKVMGIKTKPIFLRLPFYDNYDPDTQRRNVTDEERQRVASVISEQYVQYHKSARKGLFTVFLPHQDDPHPDHIATRLIGLQAIKELSKKEGAIIRVVSYRTPWPNNFNSFAYLDQDTYDKKMKAMAGNPYQRIALLYDSRTALVCTEMASKGGYGTTPVQPWNLDGGSAEIFKEWTINPYTKPSEFSDEAPKLSHVLVPNIKPSATNNGSDRDVQDADRSL